MDFRNFLQLLVLGIALVVNQSVMASIVNTEYGKIIQTQGHISASCRMVLFQDSAGAQKWFRIPNNVNGQDNGIASTILAALVANRTVQIFYDPAQTTGCGSEPQISFIAIF